MTDTKKSVDLDGLKRKGKTAGGKSFAEIGGKVVLQPQPEGKPVYLTSAYGKSGKSVREPN